MEDARVAEAVDLILAGATGVEAADKLGVPWATLSAGLTKNGLSAKALKRSRDLRNIRALVGEGLTIDDVGQRLGINTSKVVRLCRSSGITYETGRDRRRRERRETVRDGYQLGLPLDEVAGRAGIKPAGLYNHLEGVSLRFPKKARRFHRQRQRPRIVVQAPPTIPTVRKMFDRGLPLRRIAAKLDITLDEARARLRSSYPDSVDRDIRPLEHRTGRRAEAARAAADERQYQ